MSKPSPSSEALTRYEIDFILWCIVRASAQPAPHAAHYFARHEIPVIHKLCDLKDKLTSTLDAAPPEKA
jgi:hypothetical protein